MMIYLIQISNPNITYMLITQTFVPPVYSPILFARNRTQPQSNANSGLTNTWQPGRSKFLSIGQQISRLLS